MLSGAGLLGGFSGSNEPGLRFPPGLHKEVACGGSRSPEELRAEPSPHCRGRRCVEAEPAGHAGSPGRSSCRLQPPALHRLPVQVVWPGRAHRVSGRPWAVQDRPPGPSSSQSLPPQATGRAMPKALRFPPRLLGDGKGSGMQFSRGLSSIWRTSQPGRQEECSCWTDLLGER